MSLSCADPAKAERINSFSLVSYIPGELGQYLTELRKELVQGCVAHSHITILPPRPLDISSETAEQVLRQEIIRFSPFVVEIADIRLFEKTSVIYVELGRGREQFLEMHEALNVNGLFFNEPHTYHPHVTLAQGLLPAEVPQVLETAKSRLRGTQFNRMVPVQSLTFVQNTVENRWLDLAECPMRGSAQIAS